VTHEMKIMHCLLTVARAVGKREVPVSDSDAECIRQFPGFVPVEQYAALIPRNDEIGSYDGVRIIRSRPSLRDIAIRSRAVGAQTAPMGRVDQED
jgi:hypothetical protein